MSETIAFTAGSATIYGSIAGARAYLGVERDEWDVATDADVTKDMKRALVKATRYLDRMAWAPAYSSFAMRDALDLGTGGGDAAFPFRAACYELAVLALDDEDVLAPDSLRGVTSISAGGDTVTLALGVDQPKLPAKVLDLIAPYLSTDGAALLNAETAGQHGCERNPFALDEGCGC